MYKKIVGIIILANIFLSIVIPTTVSPTPADDAPWWDTDWKFREPINITINTSLEGANWQPIDIFIKFDNPCWAKDELEHSIRVIFQDDNGFIELDSQIYNLSFTNEEIIGSCNLIFLIPEESHGDEIYFIYYDDKSKPAPDYENHVDIGENSYNLNPLPGLVFESSFFEIIQDNYIVYAINKEGSGLDETISQQVEKIVDKTEEIKPNKVEYGVSLGGIYYYKKNNVIESISSDKNLVDYWKIIDGNLMVKVGIISESEDGQIRTTVIYKYYYCPTEDKKIYMNVRHELVKPPLPKGPGADFTFLLFICNKIKSVSIEDLNFGMIPSYLYYYNDEERIKPYKISKYPGSENYVQYIGLKDDQDLGSIPWFSVGEGETGRADAVIFDSNNVVKSGADERDGISIQLFEINKYNYPGLGSRFVNVFLGKNVYEGNEAPDESIPDDYIVEFNALFYTTKSGGIKAVEEEAKMYQELIKYQPSEEQNETDDQKEIEKFNLTAYVHFAPSFPFGSLISGPFGINVSYISAELYNENQMKSSGAVSRIPIGDNIPDSFEGMKLLDIIRLLDCENRSFFKKISFKDREPGKYLIKIFRENPLLKKDREFIGYKIIELNKDMEVHINCKREGKLSLSFFDQNNNVIENVKTCFKKGNIIIASSESNSNGKSILKAPCGINENYILNATYKGFLISENEIKLGLVNSIIDKKQSFNFDVYDFTIDFKDSKGATPSFNVDFDLTSNEMVVPVTLNPDMESNDAFVFKKLYPATYDLFIIYNNFKIKEIIKIQQDDTLKINLHDFKTTIKDSWNLSPGTNLDVTLKSLDFEKNPVLSAESLSKGNYLFSNLYPGNYSFRINYIAFNLEKKFNIPHNDETIIFPAEFNYTAIVFDSHGNLLENAKVNLSRDEKSVQKFTNENGEAVFSIPPAVYNLTIYYDSNFIAERKIEVLNERTNSIVTINEPLLTYVVIALAIIFVILFGAVSFRRKNLIFFLKILAISLAIIAIVSPWWAIDGSSSNPPLEKSTKLFLVPPTMVDITKDTNITAGDLIDLDGSLKQEVDILFAKVDVTFESVIESLSKAIAIGVIFVLFSMILNIFSKKRLPILSLFIAIIILLGSIIVFSYALSIFTNTTVGSLIGNGEFDVSVPGEKADITLSNSWGLAEGFYILLFSIVILMILFIYNIKNPILRIFKKILRFN